MIYCVVVVGFLCAMVQHGACVAQQPVKNKPLASVKASIEINSVIDGQRSYADIVTDIGSRFAGGGGFVELQLHNKTAEEIRIKDIKLPCRCTKVLLSSKKIASNENCVLRIHIDSTKSDTGEFRHLFLVELEGQDSRPVRISVKGKWLPLFTVVKNASDPPKIESGSRVTLATVRINPAFDRSKIKFHLIGSAGDIHNWGMSQSEDTSNSTVWFVPESSLKPTLHRFVLRAVVEKSEKPQPIEFEKQLWLDLRKPETSWRVFPLIVSKRDILNGSVDLKILGVNTQKNITIQKVTLSAGTSKIEAKSLSNVTGMLFKCEFPSLESLPGKVKTATVNLELSDGSTTGSKLVVRD